MKQCTFSPKIEYNEKYKIKDSFDERQKKYMENKKRLENKKDEDEKIFIEEMNKKYLPQKKMKNEYFANRYYIKEDIEKIKKRNKEDEKNSKKKSVINWNKRFRENKKKKFKNKGIIDIYDFSKNNKVINHDEEMPNNKKYNKIK